MFSRTCNVLATAILIGAACTGTREDMRIAARTRVRNREVVIGELECLS